MQLEEASKLVQSPEGQFGRGGTTQDCQTRVASNLLRVDVVLASESSATRRVNASIWDREGLQKLGSGRAWDVS